MPDLFDNLARKSADYTAKDIEVLEGLEPVRRRPAMYIGGTDERALHHLVAALLDNAMDEAGAGHASRTEIAARAPPRSRTRSSRTSRPCKSYSRRCIRAASSAARPTSPRAGCTASGCPSSTRWPTA